MVFPCTPEDSHRLTAICFLGASSCDRGPLSIHITPVLWQSLAAAGLPCTPRLSVIGFYNIPHPTSTSKPFHFKVKGQCQNGSF